MFTDGRAATDLTKMHSWDYSPDVGLCYVTETDFRDMTSKRWRLWRIILRTRHSYACRTTSIGSALSHGLAETYAIINDSAIIPALKGMSTVHSTALIP